MNSMKYKNKVNCLIYDDHPIVCESMKAIIGNMNIVDSVESVSNYKEALNKIKAGDFDILILDVNLDEADGFEFYRRIKSHGYKGATLFLSANEQEYCSRTAFSLGAEGYIAKSEQTQVIREAIESLARGYTCFKYSKSLSKFDKEKELSSREAVVLNYLLDGKTNKEIAQILGLSDKTISTYKVRVLEKYGVNSIIDIISMNIKSDIRNH